MRHEENPGRSAEHMIALNLEVHCLFPAATQFCRTESIRMIPGGQKSIAHVRANELACTLGRTIVQAPKEEQDLNSAFPAALLSGCVME